MRTVNSPKSHAGIFSKRWIRRLGLGCVSILLGVPLLYYGYCWGLWGRHSLLLQYLFQCKCPPTSEEARYPKEVDVIIPACRNVNVGASLSPSGRFLYVREEKNGLASAYFLDLMTKERIIVPNQPFSSFLTDDLWFVESGLEDKVIDRTTGMQYPIQTFRSLQENTYVNGEPNLELLVTALRAAEHVFLTPNYSTVVVLMPNFFTNPKQNFTFSLFDFPEWNSNRIEQFLRDNNINYQAVSASFPGEAISPSGKFVARADGIYLAETGKKIVEGYFASKFYRPYSGKYFAVRGWTYDGSGVIYSKFLNPCLFETKFLFGDDTGCFYKVPQPVILLKLPQEYLLPQETPSP